MSTDRKQLEDLFNAELYLYFHEDFLTSERTQKEIQFCIEKGPIKKESSILDLACGHGRHSNYLASLGHKVTGIDNNSRFIQIAIESAKEKELDVNYIDQDILEMDYSEEFDHVLLLFNTLGFFDKKDNLSLFKKIHKALKPNGKLILDTKNRDHLISELKGAVITEKNKDMMIDQVQFDPLTGKTLNERIYIKDGKRHDAPFSMNSYNFNELEEIFTSCGFTVKSIFGNWEGMALEKNSKRIIAILEK